MPAAIPVIIAVVADVAVGAGIIGGTIAGGLTTAFAVIGAAGATLSAIGAVTHNKGLTLAGGIIGAVGVVGSLASSAGLLDGVSSTLFGAAPTDLAAANTGANGLTAGLSGDTSPGVLDTLGGAPVDPATDIGIPPAPPGNVGAVDPVTGNVITEAQASAAASSPAAGEAVATAGETPQTGTLNPNAVEPVMTDAQKAAIIGSAQPSGTIDPSTLPDAPPGTPEPPIPPETQPVTNAPADWQTPRGNWQWGQDATVTGEDGSVANIPGSPGVANIEKTPLADLAKGAKDAGSSVLDFAKNNQLITWAALQSGGNLISGMFSSLTPAQAAAANAQAAANQAAADLANQQRQNLAGAKTVAEATPVTGAPAPITATGGSFINGTMPPGIMPPPQPQLAPVTGRVT